MELERLNPEELGCAYVDAAVARSPSLPTLVGRFKVLGADEFARALSAAAEEMGRVCAPHLKEIPDHLFRAFDDLDEILGIDYGAEKFAGKSDERIYAGSSVGVQSSYANVVGVLQKLEAKPGATLVDLGSGYGRICFLMALLRPDMSFVGYEFVESRVANSNVVAERAGLAERVKFHSQDLSRADFVIPDADFYYLYDPFTPETYELVLEKLVAIGERKKIALITKGRAEKWVSEKLQTSRWTQERFDLGNMNLYWS